MRFLLRGVSVHASVVAARYKQRGSEYLGASFGSKAERHGRIDRSLIVNVNLGPIAKYERDVFEDQRLPKVGHERYFGAVGAQQSKPRWAKPVGGSTSYTKFESKDLVCNRACDSAARPSQMIAVEWSIQIQTSISFAIIVEKDV